VLWGEPIDFNQDIGLAMSKSPPEVVKVKVWKMTCPWDPKAEITDAVATVKQLLSPISPMNHADVRAVGLNYKDHAVSTIFAGTLTQGLQWRKLTGTGRDEALFTLRTFHLF